MSLTLVEIISYVMTTKDVAHVIERLLNQEDTFIYKVAHAHRRSAMQALKAAKTGNHGQYMRDAIGHLRDVYNLLHVAADAKPTWWESLNELYGDSPRLDRVAGLAEEAAEVALLISKKHWELGEKPNARDWAMKALESFELYAEYDDLPSTATYHMGGSWEDNPKWRSEKLAKIDAQRRKLKEALSKQLA